jgi:hypothetical protein
MGGPKAATYIGNIVLGAKKPQKIFIAKKTEKKYNLFASQMSINSSKKWQANCS